MAVGLLLVPILVFCLLFRSEEDDWRSAILSSAILWGSLVVLGTEMLSLVERFEFKWLCVYWALVTAGGICVCVARLGSGGHSCSMTSIRWPETPFLILLCCLGLSSFIILLTALAAPPNNWDSLTYHMARVANWVEHKSVAHYPTHNPIQLYYNSGAEFIIANFQILSGGDRFANVVQWLCMVGSLVGVSRIAKQLGAGTPAQIMAALFAGTLPMGILQASSAQNDYVVTFWLVCFVSCGLKFLQRLKSRPVGSDAAKTGLSLGLAVATKGSAYVFAIPFLLWFGVVALKARAWKALLIMAVTAAAINVGHYSRNQDLYGLPLGPATRLWKNEEISFSAGLSNVAKNVALHLTTPSKSINRRVDYCVRWLHHILGANVDDPQTGLSYVIWNDGDNIRTGFDGFWLPTLIPHEDYSGNPVHFLLILISVLVYVLVRPKETTMSLLIISLISAFGVFCLLFKWQPWHSRVHLPMFVLMSPFVSVMAMRYLGRKGSVFAGTVLVVCSLPWLLCNEMRPLLPLSLVPEQFSSVRPFSNPEVRRYYEESILVQDRTKQLFKHRPELQKPFEGAAWFVKSSGCRRVGLLLEPEECEFPFWYLIKGDADEAPSIEHFEVTNKSKVRRRTGADGNAAPDCLISMIKSTPDHVGSKHGDYVKAWSSGRVSVFTRQEGQAP